MSPGPNWELPSEGILSVKHLSMAGMHWTTEPGLQAGATVKQVPERHSSLGSYWIKRVEPLKYQGHQLLDRG